MDSPEVNDVQPLISVVVPIYNVAPYLHKCLDSLKNQTMKQIEVICIDDGSTDESGKIAEEYKNEEGWPRFRIIHTENRGLSAARNRGIDEARADWIMFVDSDDWVEPGFCEIPWKTAMEYGADMVIFEKYQAYENGRKKRIETSHFLPRLIDESLAHDYGGFGVWNKLYKKSIFDRIRFPEGRLFEDAATTNKLIHKADRILLLSECLYWYVSRKGSITQTPDPKSMKDRFLSCMERNETMRSYGYTKKEINDSLCSSAIGFISRQSPCSDEIYLKAVNIMNLTKGIPDTLSIKKKIALTAWKLDKRLFFLLCWITGRNRNLF